jgi:methionyl aminopeptidase
VLGRDRIQYKTAEQMRLMRRAGLVVADALDAARAALRPGVTTKELDEIAHDVIRTAGATPSFLNYGHPPYPATTCISVNDEVVHGIPGPYALRDGDVLALDVGVILDGWVSDAARTHAVGEVSKIGRKLIDVTRVALDRGIAAARVGGRVGDIGAAVQQEVEAAGFSVVQSLVGHGVGRSMHEEPQVPNFGRPGTGAELIEGLVIAIEPMVNAGAHDVVLGDDGWTITTRDGSLSAHWEHTVAITADGPRILTAG